VRRPFVIVVLAVGLLSARLAAAGTPPEFHGTAAGGALDGDWVNNGTSGLIGDDDDQVALETDHACGFGKLTTAAQGLQTTYPVLTLTATGVSLAGPQKTLRSVTVRARRGGVTVCGKLRVYRDDDGNEAIEFALYKEGETATFEAVSAAIDGTADLTLVWDDFEQTATLSFGGTDCPSSLSGLATGDVDLCRVELQGNTYLGPTPSIESFDAKYEESP
jgi:hypothetical protein